MTDSQCLPSESCFFCGVEFTAPSHSELNTQLVRHGRQQHEYELANERNRAGHLDPIAISDLIRSGPDV